MPCGETNLYRPRGLEVPPALFSRVVHVVAMVAVSPLSRLACHVAFSYSTS